MTWDSMLNLGDKPAPRKVTAHGFKCTELPPMPGSGFVDPARVALLARGPEFLERLRINKSEADFPDLLLICKLYLKAGSKGLTEREHEKLAIEVSQWDFTHSEAYLNSERDYLAKIQKAKDNLSGSQGAGSSL